MWSAPRICGWIARMAPAGRECEFFVVCWRLVRACWRPWHTLHPILVGSVSWLSQQRARVCAAVAPSTDCMEPASIAIGMVRTRGVAPWPPCRATSLISINNPVHGACRHEFKKNGSGKGNWGSLHDDVMCVPGLAGGTACPAGRPVGQHAWEMSDAASAGMLPLSALCPPLVTSPVCHIISVLTAMPLTLGPAARARRRTRRRAPWPCPPRTLLTMTRWVWAD